MDVMGDHFNLEVCLYNKIKYVQRRFVLSFKVNVSLHYSSTPPCISPDIDNLTDDF